ncbi:MAG: hypothetical protein GQ533_05005 [Methanosarcinaceae archaeon]|nr:hypothetical protein [Methanosarcinaceae archaeon]
MDILLVCTMISVFCAALIASAAAYTAYSTINIFKKKNIFDQWMVALSANYHRHYSIVEKLLKEAEKDGKDIVEKIDNNEEYRESVEYILDYCTTKATAAENKIVNGDLAMRMAYHDIIYLFDNLHPWIEKRRKPKNLLLYDDLKNFCRHCKEYKEKQND